MKLEVLKRVLEDNYTDDEKIIRVQGVRDGKNYVLYEAWSGDDELVLSVAEEGSNDYSRVMDEYNKEKAQEQFKEKVNELENIGFKIWDLVDHDDPIHDKVDEAVRELEHESDWITSFQDVEDTLRINKGKIDFLKETLANAEKLNAGYAS
jgi:hypothetical protein